MTVWKLNGSVKGLRPLAVLPDGVVCYRGGALYKVGHDLQRPVFICHLPPVHLWGKLAQRHRLLDRVLRASPTHAVVFGNFVLIARRSEIWRCDLRDGRLSLDFRIPDGRRSLGLSLVNPSNGAQEVVFGEYFSNASRLAVRLWGLSAGGAEWTQRAVFDAGEIEHVHAVSFVDGRVYVLTGDFGTAAGIWVSDAGFTTLRPLARGQQSYRAAWMETLDGRVFMATDTQLETNYLYEIQTENDRVSLKSLASLAGSSIYAGRGPTEIFFSTTVECGEPSGNFLRDMLDRQPGPGMLSSSASLMAVDGHGHISELYSAQKDGWPFRLAQFGTFMFPSGTMPADTLYAYGVAVRGVDDTCLMFRRA